MSEKKYYNAITGKFETTNSTEKNDSKTNSNSFLNLLKYNLTKPVRNIVNTSMIAQNKINKKTGNETEKLKKKSNGISMLPTYTLAQFDENSFSNQVAKVAVDSGKNVINTAKNAGKEFIQHPIQTTKNISNSIGYAIDDAIGDLSKSIPNFIDNTYGQTSLGRNTKILLAPLQKKYSDYNKELKERQLKELQKKYKDNPEKLEEAINLYGLNDEMTPREYIKSKDETYQKYVNGELSEGQQSIYSIGQNIGNMLPSVALSFVNPTIGTAEFALQAYQGYYEDAINRGYSQRKAHNYGTIMGGAEVLVERLGFDNLGGLNKLSEGNVIKAMGGEALEEFVMPYIDAGVKSMYGEKVNMNDVISESIESAYYGAVVGGIMNLGGKGLSKVDNVINKINNNQEVTSSEMQDAIKEIKQYDPNYFDNIMNDVPEAIKTNSQENIDTETKTNEKKVFDLVENNKFNTQQNTQTDTQTETQTETQIRNEIINITSQIEEYEKLNELTKSQQNKLDELNNQLLVLQNQLQELNNNSTQNNNIRNNIVPTVQDIVNQEKASNNNINLPTFNDTKSDIELFLKEQQNNIIQNSNPVGDDYHTWIRSANDIKTFEETLNDSNYKEYFEAGEDFDETYTAKMAREALETGKITVYSSYPIEQGIFVSPSKMEAESYSGNGKIYSKEVNLTDVAWIDPTQGQYAKISSKILPVVDTIGTNNSNNDILENKQISKDKITNIQLRRKLNDTIDLIYNGIMPSGNQLIFVDIPQVLNNIGVQDIPTFASPNTIRNSILTKEEAKKLNYPTGKNENYHGLGKSGFNEVLNDLSEPVAIIKENPNKIIVLTEQFDYKDNQVIVPIEINTRTNYNTIRLDANVILSAHGRKSINNYLNNLLSKNSKIVYKDTKKIQNLIDSRKVQYPESIRFVSDNNIPQIDKNVKLPIVNTNNMQNIENNTNKILNPNEISKLTPKEANTTPKLPTQKVSTGRGESKFAKNIENKTNMLTKESKYEILDSNEVKYYEEVTNKESLEKAFERLNKGGESETLNWLNKDSSKVTSVDVAEGWILLKQYQDKIAQTTDISTKDDLNRSMVEVAKKMRKIGTKAGQTVQAYNILNRLTPEGMVYYAQSELSEAFDNMSKNKTKEWIDSNREKFNLTPQETEFIMKTMQEVQQLEDGYDKRVKLAEIQKVMTDKLPPSKGAGIKAWMRISMLFNPKTQVRNVMGNAIIAPVNTFSDLFASTIDKQIAKKTGVRTTGTTDIKSYLKGFKEGAYQSYNDFKKGINTRNIQGNRFEITEGKSFNDNNLIGKGLNRIDSLLSFMLDAGDRTFYEATFTNSINNQLKLNNTTEVTQAMIDIATSEALSRTWQDNNGYTRFVLNVRKWLNALNVGGYGLGDVLIPFAKTPANLTKAIVDYSPAGMIKTIIEGNNLRKSLTNGQYTAQMQHQFVQDLGKATAGTMLYVLGYALAKAGITTGESDDDKDVSNFMKNTLGVSSYSIKIGNKSFTYDWAQPIAAPFAITSNIVQKQKDNATLTESVISSLDTAGNILLEQSFLESISTVLNNNEGIATGIQEAIFELPSRAVPTLFKQIADLIDPVQRQTFEKDKPLDTAVNKVKVKIPGLSKTLAPSVDTMGREIKKYGGKNNIFNVFLNPATVNTENISESAKEIYRLYKSTGETNIMPRVAPYYINQDGEKVILNSKQRARYQKISGDIIEENIKKILNSKEYKNMTDEEKVEVINGIVNYSYNIAKKDVLGIELSTSYQKAYDYSKIGSISDYYTFKASIDDTNKDTKKTSITNYLINSNLNNQQLASLYCSYYSSEETLNSLIKANIPIKEFIKFNSQYFESNYYANGKAVPNSRKNKVIKYINSLNLSILQKALLIKMEYSSYKKYDKQIAEYVNSMNISFLDKASILKKAGFTSYDKQIINYVNKMNISKSEKEEILEEMGFTIRNGRVYS